MSIPSKSSDRAADLPDEERQKLKDAFRQMRRLSWITIAYQIIAATGIGLLAGGSQVVKTEWMENIIGVVPPIAVLLTYDTENRSPDERRPFGYHRSATIAFLVAAFILTGLGAFLCLDNAMALLHGERATIGGLPVFGHVVWQGWAMMAAMAITAVPPFVLGRAKVKVAKVLHDKPLFTDADINRANWLSNGTGVFGLLLVAFGFWWGDAVAALLLSLDILRDGAHSVKGSLSDVMDRSPCDLEKEEPDPLIARVNDAVATLPFVANHRLLIREHGRYIYAEIFVKPGVDLPPVTDATRQIRDAVLPLDWRLQHIAVEFTDDPERAAAVLTREELEIEDSK